MSWADAAILALTKGRVVRIYPRGRSMRPLIESGEGVLVAPAGEDMIEVGAIVLVRVGGRVFLHLVKAIDGDRFLIGNNRGGINGWTGRASVLGIAFEVGGRAIGSCRPAE
jgi:hypothetical protein